MKKAITIHQPYASAIIYGDKDIENRSWHTSYRGLIYIHSGRNKENMKEKIRFCEDRGFKFNPRRDSFGHIIGAVELIEIKEGILSKWANGSNYQWILKNPRPLKIYIPCPGSRRIWNIPENLNSQLSDFTRKTQKFDNNKVILPVNRKVSTFSPKQLYLNLW